MYFIFLFIIDKPEHQYFKEDFDEPAAIENISKKAAVLKQMLQKTEEKMKAALSKSDNRYRCKSTEPMTQSQYNENNRSSDFDQSIVIIDNEKPSSGKKHTIDKQNTSQQSSKTPRPSDRDSFNERYRHGTKSSLDDHTNFEGLEKELTNSCSNLPNSRSKCCQK